MLSTEDVTSYHETLGGHDNQICIFTSLGYNSRLGALLFFRGKNTDSGKGILREEDTFYQLSEKLKCVQPTLTSSPWELGVKSEALKQESSISH